MNETHYAIHIFVTLLLIASGVAMLAKRVRVPYTLMLVIVGLVISAVHFLPSVHISPDLIMLIFLPALLFEAAWNLKLQHLRENLLPILTMATAGVGVAVGVIGLILHYGIGLAWPSALLFGAMISATDPVSVLALFKKLGLPTRLTTIVEGESLFNDGTAVVVFRIILGIAVGATQLSGSALLVHSLRELSLVILGGVALGAIIGVVTSALTSYFDDHLLEITLTTIAAYGSFLIAEALHVSPVIAVLLAGLVLGNFGRQKGMSPTTQVAVNSFWEYAAFVVNSLVFLLIGLEIQLSMLVENVMSISWAVFAMLAARAVAVYGLSPVTNWFGAAVNLRGQHVLFWGGLRGSLSIALVLSLPRDLPNRSLLVTMIFGAVIFSLLVQGLTVSPLLRWMGLARSNPKLRDYDLLQSELIAETAALAELNSLLAEGSLTETMYQTLHQRFSQSLGALKGRMAEVDITEKGLLRQQLHRIERHLVDVKKARLGELHREGLLSEASHRELNERLDEELAILQTHASEQI